MNKFKTAYTDLYIKIDTDLSNICPANGRVVTEDWRKEIMDLLYAVYDAVEVEEA